MPEKIFRETRGTLCTMVKAFQVNEITDIIPITSSNMNILSALGTLDNGQQYIVMTAESAEPSSLYVKLIYSMNKNVLRNNYDQFEHQSY